MKVFKEALYVGFIAIIVAVASILCLINMISIGPVILILGFFPIFGIILSKRKLVSSIPDLIFGSIDTGMLVIPAVLGATHFGVVGAIAGGIIGDSITDAIAGFFEGGISRWLRENGIPESRDPIATALGKMAGCLLGAGIVLTFLSIIGISYN